VRDFDSSRRAGEFAFMEDASNRCCPWLAAVFVMVYRLHTADPMRVGTVDWSATLRHYELGRRQQLKTVIAAYRGIEGENYTLIWPEDSQAEFRVL
jgi:hypothetical protein